MSFILIKYIQMVKILGCWDPRYKHEYLDRIKENDGKFKIL